MKLLVIPFAAVLCCAVLPWGPLVLCGRDKEDLLWPAEFGGRPRGSRQMECEHSPSAGGGAAPQGLCSLRGFRKQPVYSTESRGMRSGP